MRRSIVPSGVLFVLGRDRLDTTSFAKIRRVEAQRLAKDRPLDLHQREQRPLVPSNQVFNPDAEDPQWDFQLIQPGSQFEPSIPPDLQ